MVTRISTPKRLLAALNYNENKVKKGVAECISAGNYLLEGKDMNFSQKLTVLENRNALNDRALTKTVHISLNFDPSEKHTLQKLVAIASGYMQKIGFGEQPYLVYQHHDAGHPHLHIVTTTINADGSRINTHNIGRNQSEKARKEIEILFNLVKAQRKTPLLEQFTRSESLSSVEYGKAETKRSISNIVNIIFNEYRYTSLPEFNAALRQFNIIADRGEENSRIYKKQGLVFRIIDSNGNKTGVPIKASSISSKPTLKNLEERFLQNIRLREPHRNLLMQIIDRAIDNKSKNIHELVEALKNDKIYTLLRKSEEGRLYGITFVDNIAKCVFNGSSLGKRYSAAALLLKMVPAIQIRMLPRSPLNNRPQIQLDNFKKTQQQSGTLTPEHTRIETHPNPSAHFYENVPFQLRKKKKKKKRK